MPPAGQKQDVCKTFRFVNYGGAKITTQINRVYIKIVRKHTFFLVGWAHFSSSRHHRATLVRMSLMCACMQWGYARDYHVITTNLYFEISCFHVIAYMERRYLKIDGFVLSAVQPHALDSMPLAISPVLLEYLAVLWRHSPASPGPFNSN